MVVMVPVPGVVVMKEVMVVMVPVPGVVVIMVVV
jgi:hypothetical protein